MTTFAKIFQMQKCQMFGLIGCDLPPSTCQCLHIGAVYKLLIPIDLEWNQFGCIREQKASKLISLTRTVFQCFHNIIDGKHETAFIKIIVLAEFKLTIWMVRVIGTCMLSIKKQF